MTKRKMKDSGVAWIGQVPEGWGVRAFRFEFSFSKGLNITKADLVDEGVPVVSYGQIHAKYNSARHLSDKLLRFVSEAVAERDLDARLNKGDFVFADTSEDVEGAGNFVLNDRDDVVYAGYHDLIARPNDSRNSAYLAYLFQTDAWRSQLRSMVQGIKVFSITQRLFKKISLILPPLSEQRKIAAFLDGECGKIDLLRGKVEKQIAALEEYRKSVITEAVTKGIRRGRKMKLSGVEWIGEVPDGWKILNLLYVLRRRISDGPHETPVCIDEGIPFISVDSLNDTEDIDFSVVKKFISQKDFELFSRRSRIEVGDILFSKAATIGKTAIVKNLGFMVWSPLAIIKPDCEKSDTKYLYYGLNCEGLVNAARLAGSMNTQANVGMRELEKVKVPLPSLSEQREIAAYLDKKCAAIDSMVAKCREELDRLAEYKKSLIYEYVTGKKEVA